MKAKKITAILIAILILTVGYFVITKVNRTRKEMELVNVDISLQARPDLLTNVLLSVGRALAVDYLWIGLQKMQEEGRYFDAMQRAEWICQLQPRFSSVWVFQAWNMSYNISVAMTTAEDRWRWVMNGVKLLRDRGIPLNPTSLPLYQQLAWIFFHKIGGLTDDHHWYYKTQLARAMEDIIGWPKPKYKIMAQAPESWEELLQDNLTKEFINRLSTMKIDVHKDYLHLIKEKRENIGEKVLELLDEPKYKSARDKIEGFLRAERLKNEWKLDAKKIAELRSKDLYGPLDFRTPQAHAIYWAHLGLIKSGRNISFYEALKAGAEKTSDITALNTKRIIYGAIQDIFRRGRFVITQGGALVSPDIRFIPILHRIYLELGKNYAEAEGKKWDGTAGETFRSGHINFLRKAIAMYYQYGRTDLARKYWKILNKLYPNKEYKIGMEPFIYKYVREDIQSMGFADVNATVVMFLIQSYTRYALGDDYESAALKRWAKMIYDAYMQERKLRQITGRTILAPWKDLNKFAIQHVLKNLPPKLTERLRIRLNLPKSPPKTEQKK